ncbi:MAG: tetratricopeptide repeat protein [Armatimonadota bacterium]
MSSAPDVSGQVKPRGKRSALPFLVVGLLLAIAAYFATAPMRQKALARTEQLRREVDDAERRRDEELSARGRRGDRVKLLTQLAATPEDVTLLLKTGQLFAEDRDHEDALFLLHEARRIDPSNIEVYRALHQVYMSQSQYDRAYDYAVAGLERSPRDLELILSVVHLDSLVGWNSHAQKMLKLLDGTPEASHPRVRIARALIRRQVADAKHAEQELKGAVEVEPKNDTALALLSGIQAEAGDLAEAEVTVRRALAVQPEKPEYLLHLADVLLRKSTPESVVEAQKTAESALRADPGNRNAFFMIAQSLLAQKKTDEARGILERLLQRYPDHPLASLELSRLYAREGKEAEARRLNQRYASGLQLQDRLKQLTLKVAMVPNDFDAHLKLGRLYLEVDEAQKACPVLRRALQLRPASAEARRELGRALTVVNRVGEHAELAAQPEWHAVEFMAPVGTVSAGS